MTEDIDTEGSHLIFEDLVNRSDWRANRLSYYRFKVDP